MKNIFRDFVSYEKRDYPHKIGKTVASGLTGFIFGAIAMHIVWLTLLKQTFSTFM